MIRVLVVDGHPALRMGVRDILEAPDILVEGAAYGEAALEQVQDGAWSLALLDLGLPGRSGFEILEDLKSRHPKLPVLIFSVYAEETFVVRALKHGASGYLTKDCPPGELIKAVRKVAAGGHYIMAELSGLLFSVLQAPDDRPLHEHLSSREFEVMRRLAHGSSLREIGQQLCISESTVSTYRERILKKLHLGNNAAELLDRRGQPEPDLAAQPQAGAGPDLGHQWCIDDLGDRHLPGRADRGPRRRQYLSGRDGPRHGDRQSAGRARLPGRRPVYTISFTATGAGGTCQGSVQVCVPFTSGGSCGNGGAVVNSTMCGSGPETLKSSAPYRGKQHKHLGLLCSSQLPTRHCDLFCDAGLILCQ